MKGRFASLFGNYRTQRIILDINDAIAEFMQTWKAYHRSAVRRQVLFL